MVRMGKFFVMAISLFVLCTAVNAKEGKVLFADDFSDASYTKENWSQKVKWSITDNGELEINHMNAGGQIEAGDYDWKDYTFEVKLKYIDRGANNTAFFIRMNDEEKGKRIMIIAAPDAIKQVYPPTSTEKSWKGGKFFKKIEIKKEEWYKFKFIVSGGEIEIWMNDEYMGILQDEMPATGKIGIWVCNCHVLIDDVKVTEIK